jgi:hypothetical protein
MKYIFPSVLPDLAVNKYELFYVDLLLGTSCSGSYVNTGATVLAACCVSGHSWVMAAARVRQLLFT